MVVASLAAVPLPLSSLPPPPPLPADSVPASPDNERQHWPRSGAPALRRRPTVFAIALIIYVMATGREVSGKDPGGGSLVFLRFGRIRNDQIESVPDYTVP